MQSLHHFKVLQGKLWNMTVINITLSKTCIMFPLSSSNREQCKIEMVVFIVSRTTENSW